MATVINKLQARLEAPVSIAPLVVFRMVFGALMMVSVARFMLHGWVHSMYIAPKMFFPFFGLDWMQPLPGQGMYIVFGLLLLFAAGIFSGFLYRVSAVGFFFLFTYVELLDKTNYLNHYY